MKKIILLIFLMLSNTSYAFNWQDLWQRPDQQGAKLLHHGKAKQAAKHFANPEWRAVANYRAGDYQETVANLSQTNSNRAFYNKANALAHLGQYEAAIKTYDQVLKNDPNYPDAKYNRDLLKKLLKQEKKKQKQQNQSKKKNDKQQNQANNNQNSSMSKQSSNKQPNNSKNTENKNKTTKPSLTRKQREQQQAMQQWLQQVPDQPGGLLQQKFLRDHYRRLQQRGELP